MTVLITLTTAGADSGPFDLYSNFDGYVSAFATGVSKSALLAGYSSAAVPDFATTIRVKSTGNCVNYIDIVLQNNISTTTTTTTPVPLGCTAYTIYNGAGADEPYSYTACGGGFVDIFIGGFTSDGPFCAVTGSLVIGGSISITLEEPCSAPATTTTTTTPGIPSTTLSYTVSGTALDACNFYGDPGNEVNYYVDDIWSIATGLYQTTPLIPSNFAPAAWYCNGSSSRYWNGTSFVGDAVTCPTIE